MKKAASSHFIFLELIRFCLAIWKSKGCHKLVPHTTSHHQRSELFQKETHVHGFNHSLFLPLFFFFFSFFLLCYNVFSIALTLRHKTTFFFLLTIYYMTSPLLTQLFCPKRESTGREKELEKYEGTRSLALFIFPARKLSGTRENSFKEHRVYVWHFPSSLQVPQSP